MADREVGYDSWGGDLWGDMGGGWKLIGTDLMINFGLIIFSNLKNRILCRLLVKKCSITSTFFSNNARIRLEVGDKTTLVCIEH